MDMNPNKLRKRFHELTAKRDAIRAKADPLREARDKAAANHAKEIADHNAKVRAAEKGLYDIDQERAMIARALGQRVGEPE
jgi:uncharacterized coiled-coil DUF342 family protein